MNNTKSIRKSNRCCANLLYPDSQRSHILMPVRLTQDSSSDTDTRTDVERLSRSREVINWALITIKPIRAVVMALWIQML